MDDAQLQPFDPAAYEPLDRARADVCAVLSYTHPNRELADQVVAAILAGAASAGLALRLWYDRSLSAGDVYTPLIAEEIEAADLALILVTEECNDATYMWNKEFEAIHALHCAPGRRFRVAPLMYSRLDNAPRFYRDRLTQFTAVPALPFSRSPGDWMRSMAAAVVASARRIAAQETGPSYAQAAALAEVETALASLASVVDEHAIHLRHAPDAAANLDRAMRAIGLLAESRRRRLIAERLPVHAAPLKELDFRFRAQHPALANAINALRDRLDGAEIAMRQEAAEPALIHTPAFAPAAASVEDLAGVRSGVDEARAGLRDLADAPPPETEAEGAARTHAVEVGGLHAALAAALLDAPSPDAAALAGEVEEMAGAVASHSETLAALAAAGRPVSAEGFRLSGRLSLSAGRTQAWSARLVARATRSPLPPKPDSRPDAAAPPHDTPDAPPLDESSKMIRDWLAEDASPPAPHPTAPPDDGLSDDERKEIETTVRDLILDGKPVPADLATLVRRLDFWSGVSSDRKKRLTSLAPLAGLASLTSLYCGGTQVSDLSPLAGLTNLTELSCGGTQVSDLSPLAGLTSLTRLDCAWTQVSDLSPLAGLTSLASLSFSKTQVSDLSPLAALTRLTELSCGSTQVSDLSPLAGLTNLTELGCGGTQVSDLSPLAGLTQLEEVNIPDRAASLAPIAHVREVIWLGPGGRYTLTPEERERWPRKPTRPPDFAFGSTPAPRGLSRLWSWLGKNF
ncbi:TIR domain-containing protein [bacterium]|nr:TIR domain-containing protein [bacterium]